MDFANLLYVSRRNQFTNKKIDQLPKFRNFVRQYGNVAISLCHGRKKKHLKVVDVIREHLESGLDQDGDESGWGERCPLLNLNLRSNEHSPCNFRG